MAWVSVQTLPENGYVTLNTRTISAVFSAEPTEDGDDSCYIQLLGNEENPIEAVGSRKTLIERIIRAERSERLDRG